MACRQSEVDYIFKPSVEAGRSTDHRVRRIIGPDDYARANPFLLMMEDWFGKGAFQAHPHRGFATLTIVLEGTLEHFDNHGGTGTIVPGDVLWLTAGRGVIHNEIPTTTAHILQLWLNLPRAQKLAPASLTILKGNELSSVVDGMKVTDYTRHFKADARPSLELIRIALPPHVRWRHRSSSGDTAYMLAINGACLIGKNRRPLAAGEVCRLGLPSAERSEINAVATDMGAEFLFFSASPIDEPVARGGPFVMNYQDEVEQAFDDYRRQGTNFGVV